MIGRPVCVEHSSTAAATAGRSVSPRPIPACCEPWPGNTSAAFTMPPS